jgi:hypothetical protein
MKAMASGKAIYYKVKSCKNNNKQKGTSRRKGKSKHENNKRN